MKNMLFIIYNIILFIIFLVLLAYSMSDIDGVTELKEFAISLFSLLGILSQLFMINKKLSK